MEKLDYRDFTDRQLLEAIFANQVSLAQKIYRISDFLLTRFGDDFTNHTLQKDEIFYKLMNDEKWDLDAQLSGSKENEEPNI